MDFVTEMAERTKLPVRSLIAWLGIAVGKYYTWCERYGKVNEHNGKVPRDHWIETEERKAIVDFHEKFPLEGYRRLTYMMLDQDVAAVSPSTTYRVLKGAGVLDRWDRTPSRKGTGFEGPDRPHRHWHTDITYVNIAGTFFYLCTVLDGYSRFVVHWEIRESMKEVDVETIIQRAREKTPGVNPRVISDNGPQFVARDFKVFIRETGMTHVRTSPYYPQSNGKIEAWHKTLKKTTLRPQAPESVEKARELVARFVEHYNHVRLHSAIGYITPTDKLAGREDDIWKERDRKLEEAREARRQRRQAA